MSHRIVLVHATPVSVEPTRIAFRMGWPEAETVNLLDDSLSLDLQQAGSQTPEIVSRIVRLARYGRDIGAKAILFTCSAFGEAIEQAKATVDLPILKPNEAMFEEAMTAGSQMGLLATFGPSVPSLEAEFHEMARQRGKAPKLKPVLVPNAMEALRAGDVRAHNHLLATAAAELTECDAVMLAQFSTSLAFEEVRRVLSARVLTSPHSAVIKLKSILQ
ncbi:MAG: arylsulfatase [Deltaproteobacteria bacterium SG8_13]|nr:MAG: arylsulfatase [Deltaproteobacteria bacterium SG8_13]